MLKRIIALMLLFLLCGSASGVCEEPVLTEEFVYGTSEQGRDLICRRIGDVNAAHSILMVFGLHGYEDDFDRDGEVLKLIAEHIIAHYSLNPGQLKDFCLYIVPTANPDGLLAGKSKDGFGRCNAKGLDINRDFPVGWTKKTTARNKTGKEPFSTAEARAIRDLVETVKPIYGMDIHGWIKASYGTGKMAKIFAKPFGFQVKKPSAGGMLCRWLDEVTEEAIMIELPPRPNKDGYVTKNGGKLIEGINAWIDYCLQ
ncbi:MAG: hypothetical protein IKW00_06350 [Clostridia bacterium]|nr:hypothetical protein [Clostridia bacterium]